MALTILMVEDSEDDLHLYRRVLRRSGYRLLVAQNGEAALALAAAETPDLILLDYKLPDLTGIEFMERLGLEAEPPVPIIMLTGEGSEVVAVEAMKGGAVDYLVKDTAGGYLRLLPSVVERALDSNAERIRVRQLGALHDAILGTVADGILGIDAEGLILFANPAAERMLLCAKARLIGRSITDFLRQGDDTTPDWRNHPLSAINDGAVSLRRETDLFRRNGGTSFPTAYTASPLDFGGDGRFGWVLVFQDITERKIAEQELIQTARYDTLTGLPNRLMFHDYLSKGLSRANRGDWHLALMFLDLDGFKEVNDTLGHFAGDQLLQMVAQRLIKCVREGDLVSRYGGDEFTIVAEGCRRDQFKMVARKILQTLEAPYDLGGHPARLSASIGIALYPEGGSDAHTLIQKADAAMYRAKQSGKNRVEFYHPDGCS